MRWPFSQSAKRDRLVNCKDHFSSDLGLSLQLSHPLVSSAPTLLEAQEGPPSEADKHREQFRIPGTL